MAENTTVPSADGQTSNATVVPSMNGQTPNTPDLPEAYRGKSVKEIVDMHQALERKLGEQSTTVAQARKAQEQLDFFNSIVEQNPALFSQIQKEVNKKLGKQTEETPAVDKKTQADVQDLKLSQQGQIFEKFEDKYGINRLSGDDKKGLQAKIGQELKEMLDIRGSKSINQVLADVPLDRLPLYLEKAYKLVTAGDEKEKAKLQGILEAKRNSEGQFGNMSSGSLREDEDSLSPEEKKVANRLGIGEEKYLKQKKAANKEYRR